MLYCDERLSMLPLVTYVNGELPTLPEHVSSTPVISDVRVA